MEVRFKPTQKQRIQNAASEVLQQPRQRFTFEEAVKRTNQLYGFIRDIERQLEEATRTGVDESEQWVVDAERALTDYRSEIHDLQTVRATLKLRQISAPVAKVVAGSFDVESFMRPENEAARNLALPETHAACEAQTLQTTQDVASIQEQILLAQYRGKSSGVFARNSWFASANAALTIKKSHLNALSKQGAEIQREFKRMQHLENEEHARLFDRAFRKVIREELGEDAFDRFVVEANRRLDSEPKDSPADRPRGE